jgi:DNA polymerase (family 10)
MAVHNSEIAAIFDEVAELLELEGANAFRVRAYQKRGADVARDAEEPRRNARARRRLVGAAWHRQGPRG